MEWILDPLSDKALRFELVLDSILYSGRSFKKHSELALFNLCEISSSRTSGELFVLRRIFFLVTADSDRDKKSI